MQKSNTHFLLSRRWGKNELFVGFHPGCGGTAAIGGGQMEEKQQQLGGKESSQDRFRDCPIRGRDKKKLLKAGKQKAKNWSQRGGQGELWGKEVIQLTAILTLNGGSLGTDEGDFA